MWILMDLKFIVVQKFFMSRGWSIDALKENMEVSKTLLFVTSWYKLGLILKAFEDYVNKQKIKINTDYLGIVQLYHKGLLDLNKITEQYGFKNLKSVDFGNLKYKLSERDPMHFFAEINKKLVHKDQNKIANFIMNLQTFDVISLWKIYEAKGIDMVELVFHGNELYTIPFSKDKIEESKHRLFMGQMEGLFKRKANSTMVSLI